MNAQTPSYLIDLNSPQREGVEHFLGPILILAGAGSGKTRVLTRRIAHLILEHGVPPDQILAVTFTNKAAGEMKERLHALLGRKGDGLWASTFHSACLRILRRHAKLLSYSSDFVVYDEQDSKGVMKDLVKQSGLDEKKHPPSSFLRSIDRWKNSYILPDKISLDGVGSDVKLHAEMYDKFQTALLKSNAMDFGDLLVNVVRLFENHSEVLKLYQNSLSFVLVDEFQDTNPVQYMLISYLTATHKNLFVVGDDDQSIYSFRGADIRNILGFERDFPGTKVVKLEQNYRSTKNILSLAHSVIEKVPDRKDKKLWTSSDAGNLATGLVAFDETEEADFVAKEIKLLIDGGLGFKDIAIFYRTNAQSRALEEALVNAEIPYRIYGGLKFYERKEVKDILAYLRLLLNDSDSQSLLRVINAPPRGIGAQSIKSIAMLSQTKGISLFEACIEAAETNKNVKVFVELIKSLRSKARTFALSSLIREVIETSDYGPVLQATKDVTAQSRIENLKELAAIGHTLELSEDEPLEILRRFLDRVSLTAGSDMAQDESGTVVVDANAQAVSLMTLHLAKGLEFPAVFLTGVEEGLLPHYKAALAPSEINEERRLLYVGMTRAMQRLYLTRASRRGMFSAGDGFGMSGFYREPSRFCFDLPRENLEERGGDFLHGFGALPNEENEFEKDEEDEIDDFSDEAEYSPQIVKRSSKRSAGNLKLATADTIKRKF